jgi:hypothetical protein
MSRSLGPLKPYNDKIGDAVFEVAQLKACLQSIIDRMAEVDRDISKSQYDASDDSHDRPPDGDDYNALWDTIVAAFDALIDET